MHAHTGLSINPAINKSLLDTSIERPSVLVKNCGGKTVQHIRSYKNENENENVKIQCRKRRIQHTLNTKRMIHNYQRTCSDTRNRGPNGPDAPKEKRVMREKQRKVLVWFPIFYVIIFARMCGE